MSGKPYADYGNPRTDFHNRQLDSIELAVASRGLTAVLESIRSGEPTSRVLEPLQAWFSGSPIEPKALRELATNIGIYAGVHGRVDVVNALVAEKNGANINSVLTSVCLAFPSRDSAFVLGELRESEVHKPQLDGFYLRAAGVLTASAIWLHDANHKGVKVDAQTIKRIADGAVTEHILQPACEKTLRNIATKITPEKSEVTKAVSLATGDSKAKIESTFNR